MGGAPFVALMALTSNPIALGLARAHPRALALLERHGAGPLMADIPDGLMGRVGGPVAVLGWAPVPLAPLRAGILLQFTGRVVTIMVFAGLMLGVAVASTLNQAGKETCAAPIPRPTTPP